PGHKEVEPLKYFRVATEASVSRQKVEDCIQGTLSHLSHCLGNGENIAFILKDVGVLIIEGTKVQVQFYYNFMKALSGKENLEKVFFKVPQLRDLMVSWRTPIDSLTSSGRVTVFPDFEMEIVAKNPPQKTLRHSFH
ncbi:Coiled-coil domain-containing protein 81, partial [Opisthocomus hoazin]